MQKKIMFVCMGNICRSPLAEALFEHKINKKDLVEKYFPDSSGVTGYHVGEKSDSRMRATAARHGVKITHRAQKLTKMHIKQFDLILAMDYSNLRDIENIAGSSFTTDKIMMFREFDPEKKDGLEVPDPYYGGASGFENVYNIVDRTCSAIIRSLENENDL